MCVCVYVRAHVCQRGTEGWLRVNENCVRARARARARARVCVHPHVCLSEGMRDGRTEGRQVESE